MKLKREIGLFSTTAYLLGIIMGAGIYVLIGSVAGITGNSLWLAFLIAAVIAFCTGLSYAELASSFPYDSAEYYYAHKALRDKRFAFSVAWMKLFTLIVCTAAVALGFGGYLSLVTGIPPVICAIILIILFTFLNLSGLKQAFKINVIMVVIAAIGLIAISIIGIPHINTAEFYFQFPGGFSGLISGAALIFFAFIGFEGISSIGEEVKNPKKTLPIALILSLLISTVLYIIVSIVSVSIIPYNELAGSTAPLSLVMSALVGTDAGVVITIMALAATGSTVLGLLVGTSRFLFGLSEQGLLPKTFNKLSSRRKTPYIAILCTSIICCLFILPGDITSIAFLTNFGALFIFLIVNLSLILLRYSHHHIPRRFKVPISIGKFPIIPAIGILFCLALMFSFSIKLFFGGIMMLLLGLALYPIITKNTKANEKIPITIHPKNSLQKHPEKHVFKKKKRT